MAGAFYLDIRRPAATLFGNCYRGFAREVLPGIAVGDLFNAFGRPLIDDFATQASGVGADVDYPVGVLHYFFVVLHDDNGVADTLQVAQYADEALGVARVKADTRLVEDIERTDKAAAERCGEVDALALAARERRRCAVEGEVFQPDVAEKCYAVFDFR